MKKKIPIILQFKIIKEFTIQGGQRNGGIPKSKQINGAQIISYKNEVHFPLIEQTNEIKSGNRARVGHQFAHCWPNIIKRNNENRLDGTEIIILVIASYEFYQFLGEAYL